jgi:predicted DNA-binding transcriptional regulator AlpA
MRERRDGLWEAGTEDPTTTARADSKGACLSRLRDELDRVMGATRPDGVSHTLVVEVVPRLAGVAEAAQVMGWDKRRVVTYIDRGRFPEPVQALASGRVWVRSDVERYADAWQARQADRARRRAAPSGNAGRPEPTA